MNIPSLPTDNLYKFASLTGVFIAVLCFGVLEYRLTHQVELDNEITLGKEAFGYFIGKLELVTEDIQGAQQKNEEENNQAKQVENFDCKKLSPAIDENLKSRIRNFDQEIMALRKKSEVAETHYQRTMRNLPILLSGGFLGIALAFIGFFFWYQRLQKYQDMLLKHQAVQSAQQISQADAEDSAV